MCDRAAVVQPSFPTTRSTSNQVWGAVLVLPCDLHHLGCCALQRVLCTLDVPARRLFERTASWIHIVVPFSVASAASRIDAWASSAAYVCFLVHKRLAHAELWRSKSGPPRCNLSIAPFWLQTSDGVANFDIRTEPSINPLGRNLPEPGLNRPPAVQLSKVQADALADLVLGPVTPWSWGNVERLLDMPINVASEPNAQFAPTERCSDSASLVEETPQPDVALSPTRTAERQTTAQVGEAIFSTGLQSILVVAVNGVAGPGLDPFPAAWCRCVDLGEKLAVALEQCLNSDLVHLRKCLQSRALETCTSQAPRKESALCADAILLSLVSLLRITRGTTIVLCCQWSQSDDAAEPPGQQPEVLNLCRACRTVEVSEMLGCFTRGAATSEQQSSRSSSTEEALSVLAGSFDQLHDGHKLLACLESIRGRQAAVSGELLAVSADASALTAHKAFKSALQPQHHRVARLVQHFRLCAASLDIDVSFCAQRGCNRFLPKSVSQYCAHAVQPQLDSQLEPLGDTSNDGAPRHAHRTPKLDGMQSQLAPNHVVAAGGGSRSPPIHLWPSPTENESTAASFYLEVTLLEDPVGPAADRRDLKSLAVTAETAKGGRVVNETRQSAGCYPLEILRYPLLVDNSLEQVDGELALQLKQNSPLPLQLKQSSLLPLQLKQSSTQIRSQMGANSAVAAAVESTWSVVAEKIRIPAELQQRLRCLWLERFCVASGAMPHFAAIAIIDAGADSAAEPATCTRALAPAEGQAPSPRYQNLADSLVRLIGALQLQRLGARGDTGATRHCPSEGLSADIFVMLAPSASAFELFSLLLVLACCCEMTNGSIKSTRRREAPGSPPRRSSRCSYCTPAARGDDDVASSSLAVAADVVVGHAKCCKLVDEVVRDWLLFSSDAESRDIAARSPSRESVAEDPQNVWFGSGNCASCATSLAQLANHYRPTVAQQPLPHIADKSQMSLYSNSIVIQQQQQQLLNEHASCDAPIKSPVLPCTRNALLRQCLHYMSAILRALSAC